MFSAIIIFFSIWGFFIIAAKLLPEKSPPPVENLNLLEIRKKNSKLELLSGLGFFVITPIVAFLLTKGMVVVQSIYLNTNEIGTHYVIGVTWWAFAVPAMFMAMLIYGIALDYIGLLVGKIMFRNDEEYRVFMYDWNKRLAFGNDIDNKKLSLISTLFVVPLFLIMCYLGIDNYTKITDTHLINNGYFALLEKQYPYSDVSKILNITKFKNAQSGELEQTSSYYSVLMKNGHDWDTLNLSINKSPTETEIIKFISQKSGIPITEGIHNIDDKL
jgi:hypothetical protein